MKIKKCLLVILLSICLLTGCSLFEAAEKTFTYDGMNITLNTDFKESSYAGYDVVYESDDVAVFVLQEEFNSFEGFADYTLEEYINLVMKANSNHNPKLEKKEGITYMMYDSVIDGDIFTYWATAYKGSDAFWLVQFACLKEDLENQINFFEQTAKSIQVN